MTDYKSYSQIYASDEVENALKQKDQETRKHSLEHFMKKTWPQFKEELIKDLIENITQLSEKKSDPPKNEPSSEKAEVQVVSEKVEDTKEEVQVVSEKKENIVTQSCFVCPSCFECFVLQKQNFHKQT